MSIEGDQKFHETSPESPEVQPVGEGDAATCLNEFLQVISGRATYQALEEELISSDIVEVTDPSGEGSVTTIACRVKDCNLKVYLTKGSGFTVSGDCFPLYESYLI
jgi:hypothetical protein